MSGDEPTGILDAEAALDRRLREVARLRDDGDEEAGKDQRRYPVALQQPRSDDPDGPCSQNSQPPPIWLSEKIWL